jgi:hypothetical protein
VLFVCNLFQDLVVYVARLSIVVGTLTNGVKTLSFLGGGLVLQLHSVTWVSVLKHFDSTVVVFSSLAFAQDTHVDGRERANAIAVDPRKLTVTPVNRAAPTAYLTRRRTV